MASRRRQPQIQQPITPQTSTELFLDALIRHQIGLLRFAGGTRNTVFGLLDATEKDIRAAIRNRLRGKTGLETPAAVRRLERLLQEIRQIRTTAWNQVDEALEQSLLELAAAEPGFVDRAFKTVLPVTVETQLPSAQRLRAIVRTFPFQGEVLREHLKRIRSRDLERIEGQIRIGLVQGESIPTISRRVVGSVALRGANGVTEITRRQAETLVRTATNAIAAEATREWTQENAEFVTVDLFVATLDGNTTPICRGLDGKTFPIEQLFPRLPLHWGERSRRVAMPDAEPLGKRPMKPVTERRLLREFAAAEGLEPVPTRRAQLPRGTKGAFDAFARVRTRELIGRVPAKVSYQKFLERQPASVQDDILGETRGRLFRRGGLELERHVDLETGRLFPLSELAEREAAAFRAAGLDPDDFK